MHTDAGTFFVFDAGTGIRELGLHLARQKQSVNAHLLLGHTHWDHISGFPFFVPLFIPQNRLRIFGARDLDHSLQEALAGQMYYTYFPVPMRDLAADIDFTEIEEGEFQIEDAYIRTHYLNHTAVCLGYRVEADGVALCYITDHEPYGLALSGDAETGSGGGLQAPFLHRGDEELIEFIRGAGMVIHDAQYTPEEYPLKRGWGHSPVDYVTDVAVRAGVGTLVLFHHEPTHSDDDLDRIVSYCRARARADGSPIEIFAAAEGVELEVKKPRGEKRGSTRRAPSSARQLP